MINLKRASLPIPFIHKGKEYKIQHGITKPNADTRIRLECRNKALDGYLDLRGEAYRPSVWFLEEVIPNRVKIKQHIIDMLDYSHKKLVQAVDRALNSGCVDIDGWDEDDAPMVLPKTILTAILEDEARQYIHPNNSRKFRREVDNIKRFI